MIVNVFWEFDLRYHADQGDLKLLGFDSLKEYDDLNANDKKKIYEKFAVINNVPLSVDLSKYWREPEHAYEEDITEFLKDKWGFSVQCWSKEWYVEDIEDHLDFMC